jgi:hypothetical protein
MHFRLKESRSSRHDHRQIVQNAPWSPKWPRGIIKERGDNFMKDNLDTQHQDGSKTIRNEAEISAKDFRDFKLFLNIIKSDFRDFSLVDGAFRSYSNNKACVVETGFSFLNEMRFNILEIKQFTKLISTLDKKNSINVQVEDTSIIFKDYSGHIRVSNPEYSDNKFVSDEEMKEIVLKNVNPNKLIFSEAIPKVLVRRMYTVSRKLYSNCICIKPDKNDLIKCFMSISGVADDSSKLRVELKKPLIIPLKENHYFNLSILPTLFNKDDMYLKCYFTDDQEILSIVSTKVNDLFVNIYVKAELLEES